MNEHSVPRIFSAPRRRGRYTRALARQGGADDPARYLFDDMVEDIAERLDFTRTEPGPALVLGDASGTLVPQLESRGFAVTSGGPDAIDEERPLLGTFGCIATLATLDTINDLPGALTHIRHALAPGGMFIGQCIGAGSLPTLRQILLAADGDQPHARIHPQIDRAAASGLLGRAGFAKQVVDSRRLTVRYGELATLIADLRDQGLTGVLADAPPPLTRTGLARARDAFDALRDDGGKVSETFEILSLTGWR